MNTTRLVFFALRGFHLKMGAREQKESFKLRVKALKAVVGEIENLKVLSAASDAEASVLEHLHTFLDEASKVCDGVIEVMGGWSDPAAPLPSLNERQAISFRVALASVFLACAHGLALAEPVSGAGSAPEEEKEEDGGEEEEEGEGKEGEGEQGGGQGEQGKRVREEEEGARSRAGGVGGVVGGASSSSSSSSPLPAALAALASLAPTPPPPPPPPHPPPPPPPPPSSPAAGADSAAASATEEVEEPPSAPSKLASLLFVGNLVFSRVRSYLRYGDGGLFCNIPTPLPAELAQIAVEVLEEELGLGKGPPIPISRCTRVGSVYSEEVVADKSAAGDAATVERVAPRLRQFMAILCCRIDKESGPTLFKITPVEPPPLDEASELSARLLGKQAIRLLSKARARDDETTLYSVIPVLRAPPRPSPPSISAAEVARLASAAVGEAMAFVERVRVFYVELLKMAADDAATEKGLEQVVVGLLKLRETINSNVVDLIGGRVSSFVAFWRVSDAGEGFSFLLFRRNLFFAPVRRQPSAPERPPRHPPRGPEEGGGGRGCYCCRRRQRGGGEGARCLGEGGEGRPRETRRVFTRSPGFHPHFRRGRAETL